MRDDMKKMIAEFLGTAVLVFAGVGAAAVTGNVVAGALAFGLALVLMCYVIGPISGCHINPAVSLAMYINKRIDLRTMLIYMGAQILGGITGALVLFGIAEIGGLEVFGTMWGSNTYEYFAAIEQTTANGIFAAMFTEIVLTFIFVLTIMFVTAKTSKTEQLTGLIIGLALALVHLVGIHLTGTSVNPARSIGTALMGGAEPLRQVWVFILAPLAGAALAAVTFALLTREPAQKE